MSRNNQKARRRGNRQGKRREEHLLNISPDGNERLSRKNAYGNADLTAYYAIYNITNPKRQRYGF